MCVKTLFAYVVIFYRSASRVLVKRESNISTRIAIFSYLYVSLYVYIYICLCGGAGTHSKNRSASRYIFIHKTRVKHASPEFVIN